MISTKPVRPSPILDDNREEVLATVRSMITAVDFAGAARCAVRLYAMLPKPAELGTNVVLVAFGGGKDSSYTLTFVRTMQLILFRIHGSTFRLRVATNRHAGMPHAVMANIDRAYHALRMPDDPDCELLLIDGPQVRPFDVDLAQDPDVVQRNRIDILMTGHRTAGDARPTFCNACNLSMVNSFGLAAGYGDGVDLIITGDSKQEQRDYYFWVTRLARRFGLQPPPADRRGFKGFLETLNNVSAAYFADIHGQAHQRSIADHAVAAEVSPSLQFFSIYDDTEYASGVHWNLLTEYLGFTFDEIAFSFTESDCGNPSLMAHLRALKTERCYGRAYADGLNEYTQFAVSLMRRKEFPERLIEIMSERYRGPAAATRMRASIEQYAVETYALTEEQLVAMVYAPFTEQGKELDLYLAREQPDLVGQSRAIRALLAGGGDESGGGLADRLERLSGLTLAQLRILFTRSLRLPTIVPAEGELIDAILAGDPHKEIIRTRREPNGPLVDELLSGR